MSTPLRVLYVVSHPLPVSESYIYNEIEWMENVGWRLRSGHDTRGSLRELPGKSALLDRELTRNS